MAADGVGGKQVPAGGMEDGEDGGFRGGEASLIADARAASSSAPGVPPPRMEAYAPRVWSETLRLRTPVDAKSRGAVVLGPCAWPVDSRGGLMCVCVREGGKGEEEGGEVGGSEPDAPSRGGAGPELVGFRVAMGGGDARGPGEEEEEGEGEGCVAALAFRTSLVGVLPRMEGAREATCVARTGVGGRGCAQALDGEAVAVSFRGEDAGDAVAVFSARTGAMVAWGRTPGKRVTALAEWRDPLVSWSGRDSKGEGIEFRPMLVGHADGSVVCVACAGGDGADGTPWTSFPDATSTSDEPTAVPLSVRMETLPRVLGEGEDPVTCLASWGGVVVFAGHASGAVSAWGLSARDGRWAEGGAVEGTGVAAVEVRVALLAGGTSAELWVRRDDGEGKQGLSVYALDLEGGKLGGKSSAVEIAVPKGRKVLGVSVLPAVECPGFHPALGNPDSVASIVIDEPHGGLTLEVHHLPTPQGSGGPPAGTLALGDLGVDFSAGESVRPFPFALPGGCAIRGEGVAPVVDAVLCGIAVEDPGSEGRRDPSPDSLKVALLRVRVEPAARGVLRRCSVAGAAALSSLESIEAMHAQMTAVGVIPSAELNQIEATEDRVAHLLHGVFTGMLDHGLQGAMAEYMRTVCFGDGRQWMHSDAKEMLLHDPRHVLGDALSPPGQPLWFGYAGMLIDRAKDALAQMAAVYFDPPQAGFAASDEYRPGEFRSGAEGNRVDASYATRPLMMRLTALEQVLETCEQILGAEPGLEERWSALAESTRQRRQECRLAISQSRVVESLLRECDIRGRGVANDASPVSFPSRRRESRGVLATQVALPPSSVLEKEHRDGFLYSTKVRHSYSGRPSSTPSYNSHAARVQPSVPLGADSLHIFEVHQGLVGHSRPVEYEAPFCRSAKLTESQSQRFRPHTLQGTRTRSQRPESAYSTRATQPSHAQAAAVPKRPRSAAAGFGAVTQIMGETFAWDRRRDINQGQVAPRTTARPMSSGPVLQSGSSLYAMRPTSPPKHSPAADAAEGVRQRRPQHSAPVQLGRSATRRPASGPLPVAQKGSSQGRMSPERDAVGAGGQAAVPRLSLGRTVQQRPHGVVAYGDAAMRGFRLEYHSLVVPPNNRVRSVSAFSHRPSVSTGGIGGVFRVDDGEGDPSLAAGPYTTQRGAGPARVGRALSTERSHSARPFSSTVAQGKAAVQRPQQAAPARPALRGTEFGPHLHHRVGGPPPVEEKHDSGKQASKPALGPDSVINFLAEPGAHALFNTLFPGAKQYHGVGSASASAPTTPRPASAAVAAPPSPLSSGRGGYRSGGPDNLNFVDENARRARQLQELRLRVDILKSGPPPGATVTIGSARS